MKMVKCWVFVVLLLILVGSQGMAGELMFYDNLFSGWLFANSLEIDEETGEYPYHRLENSKYWTVDKGVITGELYSGNSYAVIGDLDWCNYVLEARILFKVDNHGSGTIVNYTDIGNMLLMYAYGNSIQLWELIDGQWRAHDSFNVAGGLTTDEWYVFKFATTDTDVTMTVLDSDGVEDLGSLTISKDTLNKEYVSGKAGLFAGARFPASWDYVKVKALD